MKFPAIAAFTLCLLLGNASRAQDADALAKAELAAGQWLALTDTGSYAASWDQAAGLFKVAVGKASWEASMQGVRAPLGTVKSRQLKSAQPAKSLPGAPDGEYVVLQFETRFENKAAALETVTPLKDKDGSWRVGGYYIK